MAGFDLASELHSTGRSICPNVLHNVDNEYASSSLSCSIEHIAMSRPWYLQYCKGRLENVLKMQDLLKDVNSNTVLFF